MTIDMTFEAREKIFTEEAYNDGKKDGIEKGIEQGIIQATVKLVNNLMTSRQLSFDEACNELDVQDREIIRHYF